MLPLRELVSRLQVRRRNPSQSSATTTAKLVLRKEKHLLREKLRRNWQVRGMKAQQRASAERAIQGIVRKRFAKKSPFSRMAVAQQLMLMRRKRSSPLLDRLYPERNAAQGWLRLLHRDASRSNHITLQNFSFLDDPNGTIEGLRKIAEAEARTVTARIDFNDAFCLDVSPFMLLMECWGQMIPIFEGGHMEVPMQKVLTAVGIPQAMGISVGGVTEFSDVWAFPLCRRRGAGSTASRVPYIDVQTREIASDEFCGALDDWLSEMDMTLTSQGIGWIQNILGELLENAERHGDGGRRDGAWSVSGCMVRRTDPETQEAVFRVYIGIVNFGDTFSQSLSRGTEEVCRQLERYVADMKAKGAPQSADTLRTLAALQDGVTCVREADMDGRGGFGLQEMLDLVNLLGHTASDNHKPRVTIVSGSSCIQLRDPYVVGKQTMGAHSPRVLWCNPSNSKEEPPDHEFVFDLDAALPGTAISIGFILDRDYYERVHGIGADNANDRPGDSDPGQGA